MKNHRKLTCYIGNYPSTYKGALFENRTLGENNYNALIKEIKSVKKYSLPFKQYGKTSQILISVENEEDILKKFPDKLLINNRPTSYLRIEIFFNDLLADDKNGDILLTDYQLVDDFRLIIQTFLTAVNIAYLSSVVISNTKDVIVLIDETDISQRINLIFGECYTHILNSFNNQSWPKIENINLFEVWNWMQKFPDIFTGFSEGQMGRVINALKYIGETKYNGFDGSITNSMWAVVCLEILYLRAVQDRSKLSEIKKRIVATLGDIPINSGFSIKKLGTLYTFRSNFQHGDYNFPAPSYSKMHAHVDEKQLYNKYIRELIDVTLSVEVIILSTLKYIITNNWNGLEFDVKYRPISPKINSTI